MQTPRFDNFDFQWTLDDALRITASKMRINEGEFPSLPDLEQAVLAVDSSLTQAYKNYTMSYREWYEYQSEGEKKYSQDVQARQKLEALITQKYASRERWATEIRRVPV